MESKVVSVHQSRGVRLALRTRASVVVTRQLVHALRMSVAENVDDVLIAQFELFCVLFSDFQKLSRHLSRVEHSKQSDSRVQAVRPTDG